MNNELFEHNPLRTQRADAARNMLEDAHAAAMAYMHARLSSEPPHDTFRQIQRAIDRAVRMAKSGEPLLSDPRLSVSVEQVGPNTINVVPSPELLRVIEAGDLRP